MKSNKLFTHLITFLIVLVVMGCQKNLEGDLIIQNINIIDVESGTVHRAMDVVIIGDTISDILKSQNNTYKASQLIDGTDKFLIPGLWDMHTHTWWGYTDLFPLLVANGVTGIREMWGNVTEVNRIREEIRKGTIAGPEIVTAGAIVDGKPAIWKGSDEAETAEMGREIVRRQRSEGADFIKVYSLLSREAYFAIADECKKQGIPFSGHIPTKVSLEEAIAAGHGSIEHFYGIPQFCSHDQERLKARRMGELKNDSLTGMKAYYAMRNFEIETFDPSRRQKLVQLMGENNAWVCPTLVVHKGFQRNLDPNYANDNRVAYMPEYTMNSWSLMKDTVLDTEILMRLETEKKWYQLIPPLIKPLQDGGTNFLAGSDYPNPYTFAGFSIHEELELFVEEAGLSPLQALRTATINPASFLQIKDRTGSVDIGKEADLVIISANPLDDIRNTKKIEGVVLKGKYQDGMALKAEMDSIALKNSLPKIWKLMKSIILEEGIEAGILKYQDLKQSKPQDYNFDEEQLNALGYELMELKKTAEAVRIFELNIAVFPDYANGYDSLGDGYIAAGENEKAVGAWEKAVLLGSHATKGKLKDLKNQLKK